MNLPALFLSVAMATAGIPATAQQLGGDPFSLTNPLSMNPLNPNSIWNWDILLEEGDVAPDKTLLDDISDILEPEDLSENPVVQVLSQQRNINFALMLTHPCVTTDELLQGGMKEQFAGFVDSCREDVFAPRQSVVALASQMSTCLHRSVERAADETIAAREALAETWTLCHEPQADGRIVVGPDTRRQRLYGQDAIDYRNGDRPCF